MLSLTCWLLSIGNLIHAISDPAVTLGLIITGTLPPVRGMILFPVQILSAIVAAAVASGIIPADIRNVQTTLAPDVSVAQGVFIEMVCFHFAKS